MVASKSQCTINSNLASIVANVRLQRFSKASDCAGPHNHGEFLRVSPRMGSVIETKFGTKRATVVINGIGWRLHLLDCLDAIFVRGYS